MQATLVRKNGRSYAALPAYELHTLGWKAFQDLCLAVASEVLARPVQSFLPSKDGGRDGAFIGTWSGAPDLPSAKSTIQCKFTSKPDANITLKSLQSELAKVASLVKRKLAHDYVIITNAGVSGESESKITNAFEKAGAKRARIFGRDWLTSQIRERPRLRMMVPRLYGLGDLTQIIDDRAYDQAAQILSAMGDDLRCFVITDAYRKSVQAITNHSFVLLLGDPASGKSTIGASLAIGALDNGSVGTIRVTSPDDMVRHWNPKEPTQFFWVDDAFGPTQYQSDLAEGWNRQLPLLRGALKTGARILFTSRNYIWEAAKRDLKISQFPLFGKSQVIINVQGLSQIERAQILYNHIKLGDQPSKIRTALKPFLPPICLNSSFLPETARRLASQFFTQNLALDDDSIAEFVEHPVQFLKDVLLNVDDSAKAAIALIFLHGAPGVPSPVQASEAMQTITRLFGVAHADVTAALEALNGSITLLVQTSNGPRWRYKHPTISDAFASLVAESPELIEIYVHGAKLDRLLDEVVCGQIKIEGAHVRVPPSLYDALISRLEMTSRWGIMNFITYRCGSDFIKRFIRRRPDIFDTISYISAELAHSSALRFFAKLQDLKILPSNVRQQVATQIASETISMIDASVFHSGRVRSLLTRRELRQLEDRFQHEIVDQLSSVIFDWEHDWSTTDMASHMQALAENLSYFERHQAKKKKVSKAIIDGLRKINERIMELSDEEVEVPTPKVQPQAPRAHIPSQVSKIFDDVDE